MQILFAISIFCLLALVGAGFALAWHIRNSRKPGDAETPTQPSFAQHFHRAADQPTGPEPRILLNQNIRDISARKSWNQPPEAVILRPGPGTRPDLHRIPAGKTASAPGMRKTPQTAHQSGVERLDWEYFNKDMGDLNDPYETPRLRANERTSTRRF